MGGDPHRPVIGQQQLQDGAGHGRGAGSGQAHARGRGEIQPDRVTAHDADVEREAPPATGGGGIEGCAVLVVAGAAVLGGGVAVMGSVAAGEGGQRVQCGADAVRAETDAATRDSAPGSRRWRRRRRRNGPTPSDRRRRGRCRGGRRRCGAGPGDGGRVSTAGPVAGAFDGGDTEPVNRCGSRGGGVGEVNERADRAVLGDRRHDLQDPGGSRGPDRGHGAGPAGEATAEQRGGQAGVGREQVRLPLRIVRAVVDAVGTGRVLLAVGTPDLSRSRGVGKPVRWRGVDRCGTHRRVRRPTRSGRGRHRSRGSGHGCGSGQRHDRSRREQFPAVRGGRRWSPLHPVLSWGVRCRRAPGRGARRCSGTDRRG